MSERFAALKRLWSTIGRKTHLPHRPALSSSILAALLAVGVVLGFVATRASNHASNGAFASTTTTTTTTTLPTVVVPTIAAPTTTAPTTTTKPRVTSASSPCTPSDVKVSVTPAANGSNVTISTAVTDVVPCAFTPEAGGQLTCPVFVDVTNGPNGGGNQVWPGAGQVEKCSPPNAVAFTPGEQEVVSVAWSQPPRGTYSANGFWSWSSGGGQPYQGQASSGFSVG